MSDATGRSGRDTDLRDAVAEVRSRWRRRRVVEGMPAVVAAAIAAVLVGLAFRAAIGSPAAIVLLTRVVGYLVLAAAVIWFIFLPSLRRASDEQVALYVEEQAPALRQLFLSAVHELGPGGVDGAPSTLRRRVIDQAVDEIHRLERGAALERPRTRRAAVRLVALASAGALLVVFGPRAVRDVARVLFVPWSRAAAAPVPALSVAPGNISIPRGAALDVRAQLHALGDRGAEIVIRPDSAEEWTRISMVRDSTGAGYVARLFDVNKSTAYHVEAGGMRSPEYRITVTDLPTVRRLGLELHYPAYTGLPPQKIENGGDVVAVTNTTAALTIEPTLPVAGGSLHFDDGTTLPLALASDAHLTGSFRVTHDGFYRVDLVAPDGTNVPGSVQHAVEALVDHPPVIRIEKPGHDSRVTVVEEVPISLRASDDFGVRGVELHYSVNGGPDRSITVSDTTRRGTTDFSAVHTLFLEELKLRVGDLVAYHATARDGAGNRASSDIYFMEVRPFGLNYHAADDNGGAGGGGAGTNPGKFSDRQRQLIAGTFNWQRDSARTSDRDRRANATTLAIAQGKLRGDVTAQVNQMIARGVVQDTLFTLITAELDSAAVAMQPAEDGLGRHAMADAIPAQEGALQHLQAAYSVYRDITVQQRQGTGGRGGGGGGAAAQDLADLFELQTDKLKNQYETPRSEATGSSGAQQVLDSAQEKIKELAARQLQENERQRRAAEALQQRLARQAGGQGGGRQQGSAERGGGGGAMGSSQRELARQTEEQARQLEKLARDQNAPELADAARRLQEAADAMRQSAAGSSEQANAALDRLRQASEGIEGAQSTAQGRAIRELARRAGDLGQQQHAIGKDVAGMQRMTPVERDQRAGAIDQRKDALADAVRQLGTDAESAGRQLRRDQPGAAAAAETAADELRNRQVAEQIDASKRVMRQGDPEYARQLEGVIGETLDTVAERLAVAAGTIGPRRGQQQAQALERTRDLVNDLQSLQERSRQRGSRQTDQQAGRSQPQPATGTPAERGGQQAGRAGGQGSGQPGSQAPRALGGQQPGRPTGEQPGSRGVDPRQFHGEIQARRQEAESLRTQLKAEGVDVSALGTAIGQLQRLQETSDPGKIDQLQAAIVAGLKNFEFTVWRQFEGAGGSKPALGASAQIPAEYRAMVAEYYRALARKAPK